MTLSLFNWLSAWWALALELLPFPNCPKPNLFLSPVIRGKKAWEGATASEVQGALGSLGPPVWGCTAIAIAIDTAPQALALLHQTGKHNTAPRPEPMSGAALSHIMLADHDSFSPQTSRRNLSST